VTTTSHITGSAIVNASFARPSGQRFQQVL
jgi:hypothetical protein